MKQLRLFNERITREFGGSLLKDKRKSKRPMHSKCPIHLVLKATNSNLLLRSKNEVERCLKKYAARFGIQIYQCAVHCDHIHLILRTTRESYTRWIRTTTAQLVKNVMGLKWRLRPFSRILSWGKEFKGVQSYVGQNQKEGNFILRAHLHVEEWRPYLLKSTFAC